MIEVKNMTSSLVSQLFCRVQCPSSPRPLCRWPDKEGLIRPGPTSCNATTIHEPLRLQQDPTWTTLQITLEEPRPQSIMKGTYTNEKIEFFGTRLAQWQDTRGPDIQARMIQLGELRWSVQNLQIQGDLNRLLQTIEDGTERAEPPDSGRPQSAPSNH
jgi:hypothetical protein